VPVDPGERRRVQATLHSLVKPLRELADSDEMSRAARLSLRADVERVLELAPTASTRPGRAIAVFTCHQAGFYEEVDLPRRVRDRATIDATPYLRPMLAVLDESHRYCVMVVDGAHAWFYEFWMGELEDSTHRVDPHVRKRDFAGWYGLEEHRVRNRAEELVRRHYRETAETAEDFMRTTGAELLIVGGVHESVNAFLPFLSGQVRNRLAGTFAIDPHTITPGKVRERAAVVVDEYEREEETRLVDEVLERVAAGGFAAAGLDWCLRAVNEYAVQLLLVHDDSEWAGRACHNCGWLGLDGNPCPVCGQATRATPDVIDEIAATVIDTGGEVEHVYADTSLSEPLVAARLRFKVA
jgi:peptide chain release factor subunit 1